MGEIRSGASGRKGAPLNVVGEKVRLLRRQQKLTQQALAARCQVMGFDLSREALARIETRQRTVTDAEIILLALALKVAAASLLPATNEARKSVDGFRRK